jgi:hypothetical protein
VAGITVGQGGQGRDRRGDGGGDLRDDWLVAGPGGRHHGPGVQEVVAGLNLVAVRGGADGMHRGGGADRCADAAGVTGEGSGEVGGGHKPVRVIAGVGVAG